METISNPQEKHFQQLSDKYISTYFDKHSMRYKEQFIYPSLLKDIDLSNKRVCDVACGGGGNTLELKQKFPDANFFGIDLSEDFCTDYTKKTGFPSYKHDFTQPIPEKLKGQFDFVFVIGAFHHMVNDLPMALENALALCKPGGRLIMYEPSNHFFLEPIRKLWYRVDPMFCENERALSPKEIEPLLPPKTRIVSLDFLAGPAFFLIVNSMIFRIGPKLKSLITPPLLFIEKLYHFIPWKIAMNCFIMQVKVEK